MPDSAHSIIVAASIGETAPFTIGNIPLVVGKSPDVLSDSILRQVAGPPKAIIVGAVDPSGAAQETFRTEGGIISSKAGIADSVILGRGATTNVAGLAIGTLASATSGGLSLIHI